MSLLAERALVLNRSWTAITTTTVRQALVLAYRRVARIICPETFEAYEFLDWAELSSADLESAVVDREPAIATPRLRLRIPEIIVLNRFNGYPRRGVAFSRRNIYRRDRYTCQYCGARPGSELLSIDHVVPRSRGGKSSWENCVLACLSCNKRKSNRTLEQVGFALKRRPAQPSGNGMLEVSLGRRKASWQKFISDRYWNVELEE